MVRHFGAAASRSLGLSCFSGFGLGCMSFSIGGKSEVVSHDEVGGLERGNVRVQPGQESVVYYPAPYLSPPNLEVRAGSDRDVEMSDRGIRGRTASASGTWGRHRSTSSWKTRGVKATGTTLVSVPSPAPMPSGVQQTGHVAPTQP